MKPSNTSSRVRHRAAILAATLLLLIVSGSAAGAYRASSSSLTAGASGPSASPAFVAVSRRRPAAATAARTRSTKKRHKKKKHKKHKKKHKPQPGPTHFSPPAQSGYTVQSVVPWKQNASPVGWSSSLNRVIYNSPGANGLWNAYSANPDGSAPECLTCSLPDYSGVGTGTNRGASDVSPNGQYMLATVEEPVHLGAVGSPSTAPGAGADNNVWLYTTDGQHAWPLTDIAASGSYGSIWPRFDRTGNELVWSALIAPAIGNFGYWQLKVADIVWTNGVPSLADIRVIEPAADTFYEPYGFTPDDSGVIFASNDQEPSLADDQIDTINVDSTGFAQLTKPYAPVINYNEFAWYTPQNNAIIYGTSRDATSGGLDFWTMNPNGSDPQRLTYFNEPWDTESLGHSITESLAFNPENQDQFIVAVSTNETSTDVNAYTVTMEPSWKPFGLTERFYSGQNFGKLLSATTQNPSTGFDADASPAPGVPSDYSIRWTGTVTAPSTGTYSLCLVAMPEGQLLVGGKEILNTLNAAGQRRCATVAETARTAIPIEIDFEHQYASAPAYGQLSWILPGQSTPTLIPTTSLATATPTVSQPTK